MFVLDIVVVLPPFQFRHINDKAGKNEYLQGITVVERVDGSSVVVEGLLVVGVVAVVCGVVVVVGGIVAVVVGVVVGSDVVVGAVVVIGNVAVVVIIMVVGAISEVSVDVDDVVG